MRITRVRAKNFRAISEVDLELKPLTVVIGPNGAGKTTLLDLLYLFSGIENPDHLNSSFPRWGGYQATVQYGSEGNSLSLGVSVGDEKRNLNYDVEFAGEVPGCFVKSESFTETGLSGQHKRHLLSADDTYVEFLEKDGRETGRDWHHGPQTALAAFRTHISGADALIVAAKQMSLWHIHRFQPDQHGGAPQQLQQTTTRSMDGSNLFSAIYTLKTERRNAYAELLEALQSAVPELEELEFPVAGNGYVSMTWKQSNFKKPFYSNQLSDGILRFLWLVTILHAVPDDSLVMLDEPELSLHPQWLMLLVSLFRKTSARTNVLVATQSAELVRWLEPEEVVVADMTESGTTFKPVSDHKNLDKWLKEFSLAELWTMGELGGRR